jgi:teichuronic acid biosynthesis glycosyltransferase TuaH
VGALHDRIDTDAIRDVAERLPHVQVFVVGPPLDLTVVKRLRGLSNLHVKPPLSRAEVAGLVHAADVCIMPHRRTPLTMSMSPLKIYEYCGAGRPVVATDLPPVRGIHEKVRLVGEGDSFPAAVELALADGPMAEEERQRFLDAHSWRRRHEAIIEFAMDEAE